MSNTLKQLIDLGSKYPDLREDILCVWDEVIQHIKEKDMNVRPMAEREWRVQGAFGEVQVHEEGGNLNHLKIFGLESDPIEVEYDPHIGTRTTTADRYEFSLIAKRIARKIIQFVVRRNN